VLFINFFFKHTLAIIIIIFTSLSVAAEIILGTDNDFPTFEYAYSIGQPA